MIRTTRSDCRGTGTYSKFFSKEGEGVCTKCCVIAVWPNSTKTFICILLFYNSFLTHLFLLHFPFVTSELRGHLEHGSWVFSQTLRWLQDILVTVQLPVLGCKWALIWHLEDVGTYLRSVTASLLSVVSASFLVSTAKSSGQHLLPTMPLLFNFFLDRENLIFPYISSKQSTSTSSAKPTGCCLLPSQTRTWSHLAWRNPLGAMQESHCIWVQTRGVPVE